MIQQRNQFRNSLTKNSVDGFKDFSNTILCTLATIIFIVIRFSIVLMSSFLGVYELQVTNHTTKVWAFQHQYTCTIHPRNFGSDKIVPMSPLSVLTRTSLLALAKVFSTTSKRISTARKSASLLRKINNQNSIANACNASFKKKGRNKRKQGQIRIPALKADQHLCLPLVSVGFHLQSLKR